MNILGIGIATPGKPIKQSALLELANRYNADTRAERGRLQRIYRGTKVDLRHSVLSGPDDPDDEPLKSMLRFYGDPDQSGVPSTRSRMAKYEASAVPLAAEACQRALSDSNTKPQAITQLVTVSCTGFAAPGLDLGLIDRIGLDKHVSRTHIGFMGCHGAINGMRVADALASTSPGQRVLLCCTELCTLHFQYGNDPQDAVANALFADGAAAIVGGHADTDHPAPKVKSFRCIRLKDTEEMMSWRIGDAGFRMTLDSRVPEQVKGTLKPFLQDWLAQHQLSIDAIAGWIIHPGGPKVIDAAQESLGLAGEMTEHSRSVLRDYGNMSSPTVLFIADRLRSANVPRPWVMLGFGPGLVIEACLII